jgi:hypothetical protein
MTELLTLEIFDFDLADAAREYAVKGWVHAPSGLSTEFASALVEQAKQLMGDDQHELENWRFPGKKQQFLWEPPTGVSIDALCEAVACVTGLDPRRTVLAERHLKVYGETAEAMPPAHKDRSASTVTVGIGIEVPADSRLVLWPHDQLERNPFPTSAEWRNSRRPEELPEVVLHDLPPVEVDMRGGDVVLFRGAEIYHERFRPANTAVLYLKFNDIGLDPLGEDPRTLVLERESSELVAKGLPSSFALRVSPRVVGFRTDEFFPSGSRQTFARFLDRETGVSLTDAEIAFVRRVVAHESLHSSSLSSNDRVLADGLARLGILLVAA